MSLVTRLQAYITSNPARLNEKVIAAEATASWALQDHQYHCNSLLHYTNYLLQHRLTLKSQIFYSRDFHILQQAFLQTFAFTLFA